MNGIVRKLIKCLMLFCIVSAVLTVPVSATWWDNDWSSLASVTLDETVPTTDMQVHLSSDDFTIPAKMWSVMDHNGNDTRIVSTDNTTEFPIWIEHLTSPDNYSILVNVTVATNDTLNWYFGNENASSVSDVDTTFILFDDFDNYSGSDETEHGKWTSTIVGNGNVDISAGKLRAYSGTSVGNRGFGVSTRTYGNNTAIEGSASINPTSGYYTEFPGSYFLDGSTDYVTFFDATVTNNNWYLNSKKDGSAGTSTQVTGNANYHTFKITINNSQVNWYIDDVLKKTETNTAYIPTVDMNVYLGSRNGDAAGYSYLDWVRVYKHDPVNPIISNIEIIQVENSPPTIPVIINPVNNSLITSYGDVFLNVSSTDIDGDEITFYFYGDTVDGSTLIGTNETRNGTSFNWSVQQYDDYYWKARAYDGFNYSAYSNISQFTLIIPPNLTAPVNTSTTYTTYPPLTSLVAFTWQDLDAPQYRFMVAEDENFNVVSVDTHVGTNNSNQNLIVNREYFWKVYSYDGITYSDISDVYSFNLTGNSTLTGSAIEGVVYKANGDVSAIPGAEVTIWNLTWSSSMITGSNGYYVFEGLNDETVYNLQAKADRYWDSSIALVSAEAAPVTNNFYLIDDLTDTEWWHYVEFTLQDIWGVTHPGVATNVYIGISPTVFESGTTGSDGTITFHLDQNIEYRLTFINSTLGINEDTTLYPISKSYTVYIDSYSFALPDTVTDDIHAHITSSRINGTHGYINFTWSDTSVLTTSINYYIHDVDGNELYSTNNSGPNMFDSQIVAATDDRYIVRYVGIHPVHNTIDQSETVVFHGGRRVDFGWPHDWQYAVTALAFLIFIGSMFGARTAHYGAIAVVIFAWIFKWIGWLDETNTSTLLIILAAVMAFGWSLRKSEEVKM